MQTCNLRAMGRDKRVNAVDMGPWSFWLPVSPGSHRLSQHTMKPSAKDLDNQDSHQNWCHIHGSGF